MSSWSDATAGGAKGDRAAPLVPEPGAAGGPAASRRRRLTMRSRLLALLVPIAGIAVGCGGGESTTASSDGATAAAPPGKCEKVDTVKAQVYEGDVAMMSLFVADRKGFYADNCLKVERVPIPAAVQAIAQSVKGSVNFIATGPDNVMNAQQSGIDVKIFANIMKRLYFAFAVSHKAGLDDKADDFNAVMQGLVGKKVGVTALGGNVEWIARSMFSAAGLDPDSATYVAVGGIPAQMAALKNGSVDAAEVYGIGPALVKARDVGFVTADLRKDENVEAADPAIKALTGSTIVWAAQASFLKENEDAVRRFKAANDAAIAWAQDPQNLAELTEIVKQEAPLPADTPNRDQVYEDLSREYAEILSPEIDRQSLEGWMQFALNTSKTLKNPIPLDKLLWEGSAS